MMGPVGFYTLACDYYFIKGNEIKFHKYVKLIVQERGRLRQVQDKGMYEVLYGVAGYLYSLLYLQKKYQNAKTPGKFLVSLGKYVVEVMLILVETGITNYNNKFHHNQS